MTTTEITFPAAFAMSPVLSRGWLINEIEQKLRERPYGYDWAKAYRTAVGLVDTRSTGWLAGFIGQVATCENCGEPAVANRRCGSCQDLPSDYM